MSTAREKRAKEKKRELGRYELDLDSMELVYERDLGRNTLNDLDDVQLFKELRRLHVGWLPEKRYTKVFNFTRMEPDDWKEFDKIFVNNEDFGTAFDESVILKAGLDAKRGFLDVAVVSSAEHGGSIGTFWTEEVWRIPVTKV